MSVPEELGIGARPRRSRKRDVTGARSGGRERSAMWILVWVAASVIPILPYAKPLVDYALADTPYAYLVWIPAFAFFWGGWSLTRMNTYNDDAELNVLVGVPAMVLAGALLMGGLSTFAGSFVGNSVGLLLWPLWALAVAWVLFGIGTTGVLLRPLIFMMLAWPPLYTAIVSFTNPILQNFAIDVSNGFANLFKWAQVSSQYGEILIRHGGTWLAIVISSACSGSDSFLAMIILLPIVLVLFQGSFWRKLMLIAIAALLAIAMNLLRLVLLILSDHIFGSDFTFGILHPVLGMILFACAIVLLWIIGRSIRVRPKPGVAMKGLRSPGWGRLGVTGVFTVALTVALWPLYTYGAGSYGVPIAVNTDHLSALMPEVPGYFRNSLGLFDDSSLLGPGSYCRAFAYSTPTGAYAMAEEWWTYDLSALQSYGVHDCLLFHGYSLLGQQSFDVAPGIAANAFAILLAPATVGGTRTAYEDVAFIYAAKYHGKNAYIRAEFMTPLAYDVTGKSAISVALPSAIRDLYADGGKGAGKLDALAGLTAQERAELEDFKTFIFSFARAALKGGGAATAQKAPTTV
ncbi:MAG: archaeosortase/exosortase family protein [Firmicutes bacterium]|nr:archaeosortase/exosortase family protein [Bacillota bacterium]